MGRRRRELGISAALGATPVAIRRLMFGDAFAVAALGIGLGLVAASQLPTVLASLEYRTAVSDPLDWAAVLATLAATVLLAAWRPAREAMRIDPAAQLKEE